MNLRRGSRYGQVRGTVGSGLTPGSRPDGSTPEIPENSGKIPEKPENSGKYRELHVTYQIEALGMLVHVDPLEFRKISENCGKFLEILENSKNSLHWGAEASTH